MMLRRLFLAVFLVFAALPAFAVQPDEMLPDPAMEARARALSAELRCMVCQNESIDDSAAPLARDLRLLVRDRIKAGDSDAAVKAFLVARYGDFILLKPPLNAHTWLLWATPPAVLVIGGIVAFVVLRRRGRPGPPPALDAGEQAALDRLLQGPQ